MAWEFLTVYWREMIRFVRFRTQLLSSLLQPALWMAFFGVAMSSNFNRFTSAIPAPAGIVPVDYLTFMAAGVIAMTTLFTSLFGGISLLFDKNWGLMREMLASPMPRTHIMLGVSLSGMTKSFIQVAIIMAFGLLLGVEFFPGFSATQIALSVLGIFVFVGVFSLGFLLFSSTISMRLESPEGLQGIITLLTLPLFFVSNALYPIQAFPPLLQALSIYNPLTHLVSGVRYFALGNDFFAVGARYSYTTTDVLVSFGYLAVFAAVMYLLARRTFEKAVVT
ncbi:MULTISPECIES: ABC transporter permease [unclassified Methanoculleus]|uniref:ABC transporter permease n=1 Tax=unclassified Methanoculleus TaxID=2619537 RepID=UPI0025CC2AD1|nr:MULTISPECIES: ABC transporter permease [unclassified Methanoculleus]MCK9317395.1 ABC transporter permease [Methanoculleus sp.]MDD2253465.1 ABC transporter permease [Methanoculleus sp.]MDD2787521.1 ABC transporter permease [Methanoculleus sp.]MDD3215419.1 ABC transporter permease [Methanoculleus sp.]MDD4314265.1 ABC transporter permease [Methanoculleus sp.]